MTDFRKLLRIRHLQVKAAEGLMVSARSALARTEGRLAALEQASDASLSARIAKLAAGDREGAMEEAEQALLLARSVSFVGALRQYQQAAIPELTAHYRVALTDQLTLETLVDRRTREEEKKRERSEQARLDDAYGARKASRRDGELGKESQQKLGLAKASKE